MDTQGTVKPFPSTKNLALSDDGSEFIYGGSIGINRILDMFRKNAVSYDKMYRPKFPWFLYLVSGMTLFDNIYEKNMTREAAAHRIQNEIDMLMTYASSYMSFFTKTPPTFLVYLPHYDNLPRHLTRKILVSKEYKWRLYMGVFSDINNNRLHKEQTNNGHLWFTRVGPKRFPHKELSDIVRRIPDHQAPKGTPVFLLSHMPIDLHLSKTIPKLTLAERYTGLIKTQDQFGTKLNTKADVPFNTDTHRLFGDKHLLLPLIKGKKKTELETHIAENKWRLKTAHEIRQDILRQTDITPQHLDLLKL